MKTNWQTPISVAGLVLSLIVLVMSMNTVSSESATKINERLTALESRMGVTEKGVERADRRQDDAARIEAEYNLRLDRLERAGIRK